MNSSVFEGLDDCPCFQYFENGETPRIRLTEQQSVDSKEYFYVAAGYLVCGLIGFWVNQSYLRLPPYHYRGHVSRLCLAVTSLLAAPCLLPQRILSFVCTFHFFLRLF